MAHSESDPDTDADQCDAVTELQTHVDLDHIVDRLEGRNGGLRPSKPTAQGDTQLLQFIWRMARFHAGYDPSRPVMAHSWLQVYLDDHEIDASVSGILDEDGKAITSYLEDVVDEVLDAFDEDPAAGARRWKKAGLF